VDGFPDAPYQDPNNGVTVIMTEPRASSESARVRDAPRASGAQPNRIIGLDALAKTLGWKIGNKVTLALRARGHGRAPVLLPLLVLYAPSQ
jgi:hypothetical protein